MNFDINNKLIGSNAPAYIIAELSANHNQDFDLAVRTIRAMKDSGADAVKTQTYKPDSMTLDIDDPIFMTRKDSLWAGQKLYDLYKKAAMPYEWHEKLKKVALDLGLDFFSTPFDFEGVDLLDSLKTPAYKIASFEITDIPLIEYVAKKGKPVIISTGIATIKDIQLALAACHKVNNNQIALLKCTSGYPTPYEEANLLNIPTLHSNFGTIVGLSDHTLGIEVATAAVALGAKIIEKHFILDKNLGGLDAPFSLEPVEFSAMVEAVRNVERALGSSEYVVTEKMKNARRSARSLFVVKDILAGQTITPEHIKSLRPAHGLHPRYYEEIIGKKAARDLVKGDPLKLEDIERPL